jgi:hypothetical protein
MHDLLSPTFAPAKNNGDSIDSKEEIHQFGRPNNCKNDGVNRIKELRQADKNTMTTTTASAEKALSHLKEKRPLGGWSVESKSGAVRLLRRKIPVTESYFLDLHYDTVSDCVVGILSKPKSGRAQAQVLVDPDGKPTGTKTQIVSVSGYDPNLTSAGTSATTRSTTSSTTFKTTTTNTATTNNPWTEDPENKKLMLYALYTVVAAMILRAVTQAISILSILIVPAIYVYALQTCPSEVSFDAKKELKRILRGENLPENHPDKPKNFFDKTIARFNAAVTTELATSMGYEVSMTVSF